MRVGVVGVRLITFVEHFAHGGRYATKVNEQGATKGSGGSMRVFRRESLLDCLFFCLFG